MTALAEQSVVIVVAYDIKDNRRRDDVSQYLSQHGARVQLSVFEIELPHKRNLKEVQATLKNLIMDAEDQIRLWPLTSRAAAEGTVILGLRRIEERQDFHII